MLKQMFLVTLLFCAVNARADYSIKVIAPNNNYNDPPPYGQPALTINSSQTSPQTAIFTFFDNGSSAGNFISGNSGATVWLSDFSALSPNLTINSVTYNDVTLNQIFANGTTFNPSHIYEAIVNWSISSGVTSGNYLINLVISETHSGQGSDQMYVNVVPEPTQAVASCMLLGCGVLGFAGRRLLKKQAK